MFVSDARGQIGLTATAITFPGVDNDAKNRYLPAGNRKEFDGTLFCAMSRPGMATDSQTGFCPDLHSQRGLQSLPVGDVRPPKRHPETPPGQ
ncbi:hypothetical protein CEXT_247541 [Caerostris extrusa]|uniref:Uncharacterized protein n=1 Tax=Caerostris extrusa TaxID=172846 RepID=A0AAV4XXG5_CAEEX|nr:hypothetical protein CEXT_247541 [Caerostris extrusa]